MLNKDWFIYLMSQVEENPGHLSSARIAFYFLVANACGLAWYFAIRGNVTMTEVALITGIVTVAGGLKVGSKVFEK